MLHSDQITVVADNGVQIFLSCDIELILSMSFDCFHGTRQNRYTDKEVCEHFDISKSELNRMKYTLSYDFCHDENGRYKFL